VQVSTQTVQLVSAADKALAGQVSFAVDQTINSTLSSMTEVQQNVAQSQQNLSTIIATLGTINFNVTQIVPYSDFSALRAQVDSMISNLQPQGTEACATGVFGSVGCWFQDAVSTLIVIAIVAAVVVGLYCVCFKFGLAKKLFGCK